MFKKSQLGENVFPSRLKSYDISIHDMYNIYLKKEKLNSQNKNMRADLPT